jgi:hypothetical protein
VAEPAYRLWASPEQAEGNTIFELGWDNLRAAHVEAIDTSAVDTAERLLRAT